MKMKAQHSKAFIALQLAAPLLIASHLLVPIRVLAVGSWTGPVSGPPGVSVEEMLLLTDGTVMAQDSNTNTATNWYRLTPNAQGSYVNGSWTQIASMHYARQAFGKTMLQDGRAFIVGDENLGNGGTAEIYDPVQNSWRNLPTAGVGFADSETVLLPGGNVLVSPVGWLPHPAFVSALYSPELNEWALPTSSLAYQDETSWVKLPDDSILSIDINSTNSERFIPSLLKWVADATVPVAMFGQGETGPGFLLPDGRAFYLGGAGHTALYTPSPLGGTNAGAWAPGPDIPNGRVTADAPGAMMVNGKVLCAVGPSASNGGSPAPTWFYEYDYTDRTSGTNGSFTATSSPGNSTNGASVNIPTGNFSLLAMPDGTILASIAGLNQLFVYQPDGSPLAAGTPAISGLTANSDGSFHLTGTLFNGISQGAAFGDESQDATDYPLVRLTDSNGNVYYCRTYNWSSTGVQTGGAAVSTDFSLSSAVLPNPGAYSLAVVANGISSDSIPFSFNDTWVDFNYSGAQSGTYSFPYSSLAQGVNAVGNGGTILIRTAGSSPETLTITKPMTIRAFAGAATIGR